MITETDLAYAAGIVDGEGSIFGHTPNSGGGNVSIRVSVSMTDFVVPEWLHKKFGGSLSYGRYDKNPKYKPYASWTVASRQAETFLDLAIPHLRAKKEQALVALEIMLLQKNRGGSRKGGLRSKPAGVVRAQKHLIDRLKEMKRSHGEIPIVVQPLVE